MIEKTSLEPKKALYAILAPSSTPAATWTYQNSMELDCGKKD